MRVGPFDLPVTGRDRLPVTKGCTSAAGTSTRCGPPKIFEMT